MGIALPKPKQTKNKKHHKNKNNKKQNYHKNKKHTPPKNLKIQQKSLEVQRDIFNLNQQIAETQQNSEMQKLRDKLKSDDEIIALRSEIKKSSSVQLENGVLTSSDFIRDANAENQARQTKSLHEIQLLLAEYNLRWIAP